MRTETRPPPKERPSEATTTVRGGHFTALLPEGANGPATQSADCDSLRSTSPADRLAEENRSLRSELARYKDERERAERISRERSAFIANMSHEIRSPLNAVLGFAQLLADDPSLGEEQHRHARTMLLAGKNLQGVVNDVLDLSSIEAGRLPLRPVPTALKTLFLEMERTFALTAKDAGLWLQWEVDDRLPRQVNIDEKRLRQILTNLIGNALKFTEFGSVHVRARLLDDCAVETLQVEVQDTGPGIGQQDLAKVFDAFARFGKQERDGTGLGLSISLTCAKLLGGTLTADSTPGSGSTFTLQVPLEVVPASSSAAVKQERRIVGFVKEGGENPRILVVGEVETDRRMLWHLLNRLGFDVRITKQAQALETAIEWSPHVVLLDCHKGDRDDTDLLRALRTSAATRNAFVAITTVNAFADEGLLRRNGADHVLLKPFAIPEVLQLVAQATDVQYLYDEQRPNSLAPLETLTPEDLASFPEPLINQLLAATIEGDVDRLHALLEEVDPSIARRLNGLVGAFQYEALAQLFQEALACDQMATG
jgi:signal transduction histidine kinase/CheY-like chemotaxis protein